MEAVITAATEAYLELVKVKQFWRGRSGYAFPTTLLGSVGCAVVSGVVSQISTFARLSSSFSKALQCHLAAVSLRKVKVLESCPD
jgi:hypothetical protein